MGVIGWGWVGTNPDGSNSDPVREAELAVSLCERYDLDGYIANAEDPYEGPANFWKSWAFVKRFRELAPRAPLALSYIGFGDPHRFLDFRSWIDAGAALMPQCYWSTAATSINPSLWSADNYQGGIDRNIIVPTIGTSTFDTPYSPDVYAQELLLAGTRGFNVWLLDSTTDDALRALAPAIPS